jgi:hypothetical protein
MQRKRVVHVDGFNGIMKPVHYVYGRHFLGFCRRLFVDDFHLHASPYVDTLALCTMNF